MIKVITTLEQLESLERDWRELEAVSGTGPFSTYSWNRTWWSYFGRGRPLMVLAAYQDGSPIGIAPFHVAGNPISKRLEFLGSGQLAVLGTGRLDGYSDFLIRPGQDRAALIDRFIDKAVAIGGWHRLVLEEFAGWSPNMTAISEVMLGRDDFTGNIRPMYLSSFIDLSQGWEAYHAGLSRNRRMDITRTLRNLKAAGEGRIYAVDRVNEQIMEEVLRLYASGRDSVFADPVSRDFFIEMTERFSDDRRLRLVLVELDGAPIAFTLTLTLGRSTIYWLTGYDHAFHRLSPGRAALLDVIRFAFDQNLAEVDFMQGDEPYKSRWETGRRQVVSFDMVINRAGPRLRNYADLRMRPVVNKIRA